MSKCWTERGCLAKAMFFSNGSLAKGFIKACLEKGLRLGEDVYCVGFDYVDILEMLPLKYAFLDRDAINMGRIATKMLLDHFGQTIATRREYIIPLALLRLPEMHKWKSSRCIAMVARFITAAPLRYSQRRNATKQ